jgi:hypothetical protein
MTFTYNLGNAIGQVRLLIDDKTNVPTAAYFTDEEITALLGMVANVVYLTAALCLRIMAGDRDYLANSFTIGSYSESNDKAKELLALAKSYEDLAKEQGIGLDGYQLAQEAIAEMAYDDANWLQILMNKTLRGDTD